MKPQIAGLPWFAAGDYTSFRAILPDRQWHATHADWLHAAQRTKQRLEQSGIRAIEVHVHSAEFADWCRNTGRDIETESLTAFANEAALRVYLGEQAH